MWTDNDIIGDSSPVMPPSPVWARNRLKKRNDQYWEKPENMSYHCFDQFHYL